MGAFRWDGYRLCKDSLAMGWLVNGRSSNGEIGSRTEEKGTSGQDNIASEEKNGKGRYRKT